MCCSAPPARRSTSRDTGFSRRYERDNFSRYDELVSAGEFSYPVAESARDDRLGAADIVVVVTIDETTVAYPAASMDATFTDTIGEAVVTVTPHDLGASVRLQNGDAVGTRTAFWFSVVSAFPDVEVRTP